MLTPRSFLKARKWKKNIQLVVVLGVIFGIPLAITIIYGFFLLIGRLLGIVPPPEVNTNAEVEVIETMEVDGVMVDEPLEE